jgi:hypothetical protein
MVKTLTVYFKGARDLYNTSSWSSQSPYARCWTSSTRDQKFETRVSKGSGTSAIWNDTAKMNVVDDDEEYFYVEVKAKGTMSDTLIGRLKVPCRELPSTETDMTLRVITEQGEDGGEIRLRISFILVQQYVAPKQQSESKVNPEPFVSNVTIENEWIEKKNLQGATYYYNNATKTSQFDMPEELKKKEVSPKAYSAPNLNTPTQILRAASPAMAPSAYTYGHIHNQPAAVRTPAPAPVPAPAPAIVPAPASTAHNIRYVPPPSMSQSYISAPAPVPAVPVVRAHTYRQPPSAPAMPTTNHDNSYNPGSAYPDYSAQLSGGYTPYPGQNHTATDFNSSTSSYPGQVNSDSFGSGYQTQASDPFANSGAYPGQVRSTFGGEVNTSQNYYTSSTTIPTPAVSSHTQQNTNRNGLVTQKLTCSMCTYENTIYGGRSSTPCEICGAILTAPTLNPSANAATPSRKMPVVNQPYVAKAPRPLPPLPDFWEEREHNGKKYYVNHITKSTTWTRPTS